MPFDLLLMRCQARTRVHFKKPALALAAVGLALFCPAAASANTVVFFDFGPTYGNVEIELFDYATPKTVQNFLNYVNGAGANHGTYDNSIVHRSIPSFIIQGGAITNTFAGIPTDPPVVNEFNTSNVRGTISMAKLDQQPNSATDSWFINLGDNSSNLDHQNGGFTVFGQVINNTMTAVDKIAAVPTFNSQGLANLPLSNYTQADANANKPPTDANLVILSQAFVANTVNPAFQRSTFVNPEDRFDVSGNSRINAADARYIINQLRVMGPHQLPDTFDGDKFYDVNGDHYMSRADAQAVVDFLKSGAAEAYNGRLSVPPQQSGALLGSASGLQLQAFPTPEPSALVLALVGIIAVGAHLLRRRMRGSRAS